jgi:hypothetical protein
LTVQSPVKTPPRQNEINSVNAAGESVISLDDPRWQLVQRVVASQTFKKTARLRAFLTYVSECRLRNEPDLATEQQIGVRVFGCAPNYDSSENNIVRSQARQLRLKLESYFANEGRDEPEVIVIPKGAYVPEFHRRAQAPEAEAKGLTGIARPAGTVMALAATVVVLAGACLWLLATRRAAPQAAEKAPATAFDVFWSRLFQKDVPTLVAVTDHTHLITEDLMRRRIPLNEYIGGEYRDDVHRAGVESAVVPKELDFADYYLTDMSSLLNVVRIARLGPSFAQQMQIRPPRDFRLRDFVGANAILMGARPANPWVELFDHDLNFRYRRAYGQGGTYCVNLKPKPGEAAEYHSSFSGTARTEYGGVAFVPGLNRRGSVLIVFGTSGAIHEVSAEFVTNERLSGKFLDGLTREAGGGQLPYFEVLLKSTSVGDAASDPEIVAYRIVH